MPEELNNDAPKDEGVEQVPAQQEPTQQEPTPFDELKSFMENHNLKSPDDFSDFVQDLGTTAEWKQKYGSSQNEVGELRRKVEELSTALNQAAYDQNQYNQQYYDPNYQQQQQPRGLTADQVAETMNNVLSSWQERQTQGQLKYMAERNEIMRRPGWNYVQPHFDKALMDPNIQFALQSGKLTQDKLYNSINERVLMSKVNSVMETLPQGKATQEAPPGQETGDRVPQPPGAPQAKQQQIKKAVENLDPDALAKVLIPDDDPIFRL
jgi:hypothetical protein